jgi:hypothetical protein
MEAEHPNKIVIFRKQGLTTQFSPVFKSSAVGRLEINGLEVRYQALGGAGDGKLSWRLLSFADRSVIELIDLIGRESWTYHDKTTATLVNENGNLRIETDETGKHDCLRGPLFFETGGGVARLRYSRANLLEFGFPVEELTQSLSRKPMKRAVYSVAEVPVEGGLWIELAPGRVAEMPPNIVVGQRRKEEFRLDAMNWDAFASGDLIELEATSRNPLLADQILIRDWKPGARGAFGRTRALVPVAGADPTRGMLTLGAGEYTLVIPEGSPDPSARVIALYPSNRIDDRDIRPQPDDVVLLGLNDLEEPIVIGFDDIRPRPARNNSLWTGDSLASDFLIDRDDKQTYSPRAVAQLIKDIGGALPVTVESMTISKTDGQPLLYFSRRIQRQATMRLAGRISFARVGGFQAIQGSLLLRCGGDILKVKASEFIAGLPDHPELLEASARELKKSGTLIYLHGDAEGRLRSGLPLAEYAEEPLVSAVHQPFVEHSETVLEGLICRAEDSLGLCWLPSARAAWAHLSADQLGRIYFSKDKQYFKAKRLKEDNDSISVVAVNAVKKEFESYRIGKQLVVGIREKVDTDDLPARYLVESFGSKVVMECEVYDGEELPMRKKEDRGRGPTLTMEVDSYSISPDRLTVVPLGKRQLALDLPEWMTKKLSSTEPSRRKEFDSYLRWLQSASAQPSPDVNLEIISFDQLNRLLVQVFANIEESAAHDEFAANAALAWKNRIGTMGEVDLAYGLTACLLLEFVGLRTKNQSWRTAAREIAQDLGGRALRSVHIETLYREWILDVKVREDFELGRRLRRVINGIKSPPTKDNIEGIKQVRRAVLLRNITENSLDKDRKIQDLSDGLSACVGELSDSLISQERTADWATRTLAAIYTTLPYTAASVPAMLHQEHVNRLKRILAEINRIPLDITLLHNLTKLKSGTSRRIQPFGD